MCRIMAIGDETATLDRPVALHGMTLGCGFAFVDGTNRIDLGRSGIRALDATSAKAYSIGVLAPEGLLGRAAGEDAPAVREAPRGAGRPDGVGEAPDVSSRHLTCNFGRAALLRGRLTGKVAFQATRKRCFRLRVGPNCGTIPSFMA